MRCRTSRTTMPSSTSTVYASNAPSFVPRQTRNVTSLMPRGRGAQPPDDCSRLRPLDHDRLRYGGRLLIGDQRLQLGRKRGQVLGRELEPAVALPRHDVLGPPLRVGLGVVLARVAAPAL